jgi:MFS family permease
VAPIAVPLISAKWGWQGAFIATGALGFSWFFGWLGLNFQPEEHPRLAATELRYIQDGAEEHLQKRHPGSNYSDIVSYGQWRLEK